MPRAGLTTERVVAEAASVADEVGWEKLSLAGVAGRLGVKLPSLYKHVASLEAMRDGVTVLGTRELGAALATAVMGKSRSKALAAMAQAYRDFARSRPGRYTATLKAPRADNPEHVEAAETVMRVVDATLDGYGLAGDDAVDAARMVRAALHGFVSLEAAGGFGLPTDVERSFRRVVAALDGALQEWPPVVA